MAVSAPLRCSHLGELALGERVGCRHLGEPARPGERAGRLPQWPEQGGHGDRQARQVTTALDRRLPGRVAHRVRGQHARRAAEQRQPHPGRHPHRRTRTAGSAAQGVPRGERGEHQQHRERDGPPELPGGTPAGGAEAHRQRWPEDQRAVQPVRPVRSGAGATRGQHRGHRVATVPDAVHQHRGRAQQQRAGQHQPGPPGQFPSAPRHEQHAERQHVRQDQRVHPEQHPGDQSPRRPAGQPRARPAHAKPDREQRQRRTGRVQLRIAATGDELVLHHPVRAERQHGDDEQGVPAVTAEPPGQPPGQQQEQRVQRERGQPQHEHRRPGERDQRRGQVRLQRAHVRLAVEPDREALTAGDVQGGQPHRRLVAVGGRHVGEQQRQPIAHPGEPDEQGEQRRQRQPPGRTRAHGFAWLLAYPGGHACDHGIRRAAGGG